VRHPRLAVAGLSLSAAAFAALVVHEGYTDRPVIPVQGDRPTIGFGSTFREDGSPVRLGDGPITPPQAVKRSLAHIERDETRLRQCVTAPVSQVEYDLLVDHAYQYGSAKTCTSTIVRRTNAGDYRGACQAYLMWRRAGGYDCSTLIDGKPNKRCWGVWERSVWRHDRCMGAQG
jgi:GH24 family phage-related lysozyme (muramidase)